jgi:branched-chain amino acid transport system ATP-binding protein
MVVVICHYYQSQQDIGMLLEVEKVSKSFGGLQALSNISFTVEPCQTIGLIGPNGSGKSTLFNVITGNLPVTSGAIRFEGKSITKLTAHRVSQRGIGRTFQTVRPFMEMTVLDNVKIASLYGHSSVIREMTAEKRAYQVLELVKLQDQSHVPVKQLNVMARKWLEIARALATEPKLLLLDEFMAGLNPSEVQNAIEFVKSLKDMGITVIIVEHIIKAIMNCSDHIIVLNAGQKIAEGPPTDIVNNPQVIRAYLGPDYAQN